MGKKRDIDIKRISELTEKVKIIVPIPQYSVFTGPKELDFVGQGLFKIVFRYDDHAIKIFKFRRVRDEDIEKFTVLSQLETFEEFTSHGSNWFATKYITGTNLKGIRMMQLKPAAIEQVKQDMLACLALGWSPNDLHFGNFLVEPSGRIRCIDVDLFNDIRQMSDKKKEKAMQSAQKRVEGLYKKMLRYTV